MKIQFHKYQGTGNDFVIVDDRNNTLELSLKDVAQICDRRFGIGADGLMLLRTKKGFDFEMVYYNSDGKESTMCGNGGRCIVAFAKKQGVISESAKFWAIDGEHFAKIKDTIVDLGMIDVNKIESLDTDFELFTGSPHYVQFKIENVNENAQFVRNARAIRYNDKYSQEGINVNHVTKLNDQAIAMRTYERGVEDETFSCGTGAVAAAIATHKKFAANSKNYSIMICTPGGKLNVSFVYDKGRYTQIVLSGAATFVFEGIIEI
ncbi:MAG: diaminopimelate epimerase [Bacteroidia bacterium]